MTDPMPTDPMPTDPVREASTALRGAHATS